MSLKTKNLLSTLAVLAATSAPARAESPSEFLDAARRTARAISPCQATADDLVSQVAMRLWSRHRDVLERVDFRSYVEASIRNAWRDHLRKRRATPFSDLDGQDADAAPQPVHPVGADSEATAALDEFRGSLSASDREVLSHLEAGHADRRISMEMSRTRHWVRGSVQRIRRQAERYFGARALA